MERGVLGSWREMARGLGQRVLSEGRGGFWKGFLKNRGWGVFDVRGVYKHVMRVIFFIISIFSFLLFLYF